MFWEVDLLLHSSGDTQSDESVRHNEVNNLRQQLKMVLSMTDMKIYNKNHDNNHKEIKPRKPNY
jgi:hypothetical protein